MQMIAKRIRILRRLRGYTRKELAKKIRKSAGTIYHWENDVSSPRLDDIPDLAKALRMPAAVFLLSDEQFMEALARAEIETQQ